MSEPTPTPDHTLTLQVQIDVRDDRTIESVAHAISRLITTADLSALDDIGQVSVIPVTAPRMLWAAYVGTANGSDISLHGTRRDALDWCAEFLAIELNGDEDAEELEEALQNHCNQSADDFEVREVEIE